jgi:hypothetical protein
MSIEHWWNNIGRGTPKYLQKNLSQGHLVHQNSHMGCTGQTQNSEIKNRLCRQTGTVGFSAIFSLSTLSVVISLRYRIFSSCLPFTFGWTLCSVTVLFGCSSKFFFRLSVLKKCFGFSDFEQGSCWCCPDFGVFMFG